MTDCPDGLTRDLLPEYAHGALGAAEAERVRAHLAGCAVCREELALLAQVREAMTHGTARVDVAAIVAALPAPRGPVRRVAASHRWQYLAAAGLVLAVGSGVLWQRAPGEPAVRVADSSLVRPAPRPELTPAQSLARPEDGIVFGGGLSDLSLNDLQVLLGQMDSVRTLPSTDPESMTPVIAMNGGGKTL